jgi:excisionase family DNA binding protein
MPRARTRLTADAIGHDYPGAAARLGIGESLLRELVEQGKIAARKVSERRVLILDEDLRTFARSLPCIEPKKARGTAPFEPIGGATR